MVKTTKFKNDYHRKPYKVVGSVIFGLYKKQKDKYVLANPCIEITYDEKADKGKREHGELVELQEIWCA